MLWYMNISFPTFQSSAARSLKELLASNPAKSPAILNHLKTTLFNLLGKSGIEIGQHTIIHRALLDYIMQISFQEEKTASTASTFTQEVISETPAQSPVAAASSAPAPLDADGNPIVTGANAAVNIPKTAAGAMSELIDLLQDHLIHILHTREGSQVTQLCITHASPKQRKQLIKSFKSYVKKIAMETYGCAALVSLLECVDDTVLVGKQILSELFADARVGDAGAETNGGEGVGFAELCRDKNASRVLMYLVLGRSRKYLPSFVVIELEKMDSIRRRTSKKDLDAKQRELMKVALPAMLKGILENADELLRCKTASSLVAETLKYAARSESAVEQCKAIVEKLAEMASGLPSLIKFNDVDMEVDLTKKADEEEEEGDEDDEESEEEEEEEDSSAAKEKQPAPTTVTTTTTTTTAKSSTKAFNAVQKLRDAKVAQKQLASGINLNEHVLVSRAATFAYKDLISNRAAVCSGESNESQTSGGIRDMLVPALAAAIAPHMQYWISYCCASPQTTSGTAFILVSLLESGNAQVVKEVKKAIKGAEGFKDAANSVTEWRKSVGDATAAKPVVATTTASKGKKRKNGGVDKKTIDQGVKKNTGIEILLSLL